MKLQQLTSAHPQTCTPRDYRGHSSWPVLHPDSQTQHNGVGSKDLHLKEAQPSRPETSLGYRFPSSWQISPSSHFSPALSQVCSEASQRHSKPAGLTCEHMNVGWGGLAAPNQDLCTRQQRGGTWGTYSEQAPHPRHVPCPCASMAWASFSPIHNHWAMRGYNGWCWARQGPWLQTTHSQIHGHVLTFLCRCIA